MARGERRDGPFDDAAAGRGAVRRRAVDEGDVCGEGGWGGRVRERPCAGRGGAKVQTWLDAGEGHVAAEVVGDELDQRGEEGGAEFRRGLCAAPAADVDAQVQRGGVGDGGGGGRGLRGVDPETGEELEVLEELVGVAEASGGLAGRGGQAAHRAEGGGVGGGELLDALEVDFAGRRRAGVVEEGRRRKRFGVDVWGEGRGPGGRGKVGRVGEEGGERGVGDHVEAEGFEVGELDVRGALDAAEEGAEWGGRG